MIQQSTHTGEHFGLSNIDQSDCEQFGRLSPTVLLHRLSDLACLVSRLLSGVLMCTGLPTVSPSMRVRLTLVGISLCSTQAQSLTCCNAAMTCGRLFADSFTTIALCRPRDIVRRPLQQDQYCADLETSCADLTSTQQLPEYYYRPVG